MIEIRDWEKEKVHSFSSERDAQVFMMGKLIIKYMEKVNEEDTEQLAKRLGYEVIRETDKPDTGR
jgi:hypothetical protein